MKISYYSSIVEIQKELGFRVKSARIDKQLTQEGLAAQAGVSPKTVSNLETGKDVSFKTVIEVLRALGFLQNMDLLLPERPSQLAEMGKKRERAPRQKKEKDHADWTWGDEK